MINSVYTSLNSGVVANWGCAKCVLEWKTIQDPFNNVRILESVHSRSNVPVPQAGTYGTFWISTSWSRPYGGVPFVTPEPKEEPDENPGLVPTILGRVIGYRGWCVDLDTMRLKGTGGYGDPWTPGINVARCALHKQHLAPKYICNCGLHALARFQDSARWWSSDTIVGAVEAWADPRDGVTERFIIHDDGFRSQYARIVLLAVDEDWEKPKRDFVKKILAPYYEADVCRREHLEDAAKEHGQLVPEDLVTWAKDHDPGANQRLARKVGKSEGWKISPTFALRRSDRVKEMLDQIPQRKPKFEIPPPLPF